MNKQEKLLKYIKSIYEMESSLFMMDELYNQMSTESNNLRSYKGKNTYSHDSKPHFFQEDDIYLYWYSLIFGIVGCFVFWGWHFAEASIWGFLKELFVHFICGTLIGAVIISIPFVISYLNRIKKWNKRNADTDTINLSIIEQNRNEITLYQKQANILESEMEELDKKYDELCDTLNAYYDLNIIYPKYRNFVAISTFYEYLLSGRCNTLEGHGGAYDTFEYESKLNHIIVQLDHVINSLDQIQSNQYQLYTAIENGFSQSNALFESVANGINRLETSQELNNYYNRITAQNSEYFKLIHFYNGRI